MFLFYNRDDKIIQGFGCMDFKENNIAGFNSYIHKQYEGDFKIPDIIGDLRIQDIITQQDQSVFDLEFEYTLNKNNISVYKLVSDVYELVSDEEYEETDSNTITFSSAFDSGVSLKFSSYQLYEYIFDEDSNTFSISD